MNDLDTELNEKYYRRELTEAERAAFEQRLAADEAFRQAAALHERSMAAIRFDGLKDLKGRYQEREAAFRQQKNKRPRLGLVAFLLLALLAAAWWFWGKSPEKQAPAPTLPAQPTTTDSLELPVVPPPDTPRLEPPPVRKEEAKKPPAPKPRKPDAQALFAASFQPYREASLNPLVRDESRLLPFEQFLLFYWQNKHSQALAAFENISPDTRSSDDALFLKANSLLATGQATEAAALFESILAHGVSGYAGQCRWYLALCFLKKGDWAEAKKQLETLASDADAPRREDALRLLAPHDGAPHD